MGLDVYVGSVTRYTLGDWLTIVQQTLTREGQTVQIVRTNPDPEDVITDPAAVADAVDQWQTGLLGALGGAAPWPECADLPYWTDKPDWDGYGGLVLLAAYDERPDLAPASRRGLLRREVPRVAPRDWQMAPAFVAASGSPKHYPGLLSGVEMVASDRDRAVGLRGADGIRPPRTHGASRPPCRRVRLTSAYRHRRPEHAGQLVRAARRQATTTPMRLAASVLRSCTSRIDGTADATALDHRLLTD